MSQWGCSDSGILRKNKVDNNLDELLVFGYSCKIFRDDEKALYVDQGKHLIPWMGDESLKIDRYDGRGALSDLKKYEASREDYDTLRWMGLSESEKKLEELCDSERYYSLEINEEEEEMYKEEAVKRKKTNAFAFDYNTAKSKESEQQPEGIPTVPEREEIDEPYKPSPILDVPVDINIPKTVKEYTRIEKTALFVCKQGLQMEILIKAKQADNPQFSFLTLQDPLYKFYRHLLEVFKNGRYQPQYDKKPEPPKQITKDDDAHDSHYLHPSLQSTTTKPESPNQNHIPSPVLYRPSADCAYSQLVSRIQGTVMGGSSCDSETPPTQMQLANHMTLEQQYQQYYYVQQFYEYWRHAMVANNEQGANQLPLNFNQLDNNMQNYIHQMAWAQFVQQHQQKQMHDVQKAQDNANNNPYAQIVLNLNKDGGNRYTANVPQLPPVQVKVEPKVVASDTTGDNCEKKIVKKTLLSLAAAYGSGSESDSSDNTDDKEDATDIRVPPSNFQILIDKMAEYVFKNGDQFEEIIKQKGDSRFLFLNKDNEYFPYYRNKLDQLRTTKETEEKTKAVKFKSKKPIAPVSFSIKKPKEELAKEIRSALPLEDSSEDEDTAASSPQNDVKNNHESLDKPSNASVSPNNKTVKSVSKLPLDSIETYDRMSPNIETNGLDLKPQNVSSSPKRRSRSPIDPQKKSKSRSLSPVKVVKKRSPVIDMFDDGETTAANGNLEKDDPILEMMDLEKEQPINDEKIADVKEKARQLERKRKAAMFLKLKSQGDSSDTASLVNRRNSGDSVIVVRSRSASREKSKTETSRRDKSKSRSRSIRSRSRNRKNENKRHKTSRKSDSSSRDEERSRRRRKEKRKKSHKRKHSRTKKRDRKHKRSRSASKSISRSRSRSRHRHKSRSSSEKSHISINSS
ncbi:hypothetical protein ABEB36_007825 [Hypothenemus hampei]|uniref:SURP motif domain-containing protein n=1 Tax=Hypothenemus hampei TaxID=57062 RepID=A0ABD1EWA6_HYPHA